MNLPLLSWKYLLAKPLNTFLNTLILSLGVGIIIVLLLVGYQVEQKLTDNAKGIDLVVGAKGSPLQLILCNIFHIDFPTGNIPLEAAQKVAKHPMVKYAIPLALGDSHKGFRIVGTNHQYTELYKAELAEGTWWQKNMEVTLGSKAAQFLGLKVGEQFIGGHGIGSDLVMEHAEHPYIVKGILKPSNTILDDLIFTNIESVWQVHQHEEETPTEEGHKDHETAHEHDADKHNHAEHDADEHNHAEHDADEHNHGSHAHTNTKSTSKPHKTTGLPEGEDKEITALLLKFKSPMAAIQFPRFINQKTEMQAASPAYEIARLADNLGVGIEIVKGFAYLIVIIAVLSIFIALYNALKERKYDLSIMRALGFSRQSLFFLVIFESIWMTIMSALLGIGLGHMVVAVLGKVFETSDKVGITAFIFLPEEFYVFFITLLIGGFTALIPAIQAYNTNISDVLAKQS